MDCPGKTGLPIFPQGWFHLLHRGVDMLVVVDRTEVFYIDIEKVPTS